MCDTDSAAGTKVEMAGSKAGAGIYQWRPTPALVLQDKRSMAAR
jgi:hypothetical protein